MRGKRFEDRNKTFWGIVLIAIGAALLLRQLEIASMWGWWPAALILIGLARIVTRERPRQIASGISFVLWGLWFFACTWHWYGLRYRNAWPLLLVIFGAEMIVAAALERMSASPAEKEGPHA